MNKKGVIKLLWKKYSTIIFWVIAAIFFIFSYSPHHSNSPDSEAKAVQRKLLNRIKVLDNYAEKALNTPPNQWVEFEYFPEDMVLYKYNSDTLQSWVNLFPISNDDVDMVPIWYRIHNMNNRNVFNTPLAYLNKETQYINLGSSWYVIKIYKQKWDKVIAGIIVKSESWNPKSQIKSSKNSKIGLSHHYTTVPVNIDDSHVVFSKEGVPLFSVISDVPLNYQRPATGLRWISMLFAIIGLFSIHYKKRSYKSLIILLSGLIVIRFIISILAKNLSLDSELFSPTLFADGNYFNSLGNLLINSLFLFLFILSLFIVRRTIINSVESSGRWLRRIKKCIAYLFPLLLAGYIHLTLRSLLFNSSITMELFLIQFLDIYSILSYISYGLLFLALLFCIQTALVISGKYTEEFLSTPKKLTIYILTISLYTVLVVSLLGFRMEYEKNKVITNKLAVDRDLSLEFQLRAVENSIYSDPIIKVLLGIKNTNDIIKNRLEELYLGDVTQKYNIRITVCKEYDQLETEEYSYNVNCFNFFKTDIIDKHGISITPVSSFYFINNYDSTTGYLGVFPFFINGILYRLYIEIDSKPDTEIIGYPSLLIGTNNAGNVNIAGPYSYAKYFNDRLTSYKGRYNYSVVQDMEIKDGYSFYKYGGYSHFSNKISDDQCVIISRPSRSFMPYIVSFSYMVLFYAAIFFSLSWIRRKKHGLIFATPKNSFRKKITYLVTTVMVVTLIFMGIGSIMFTIGIINENNRVQMEDKVESVQNAISEMCKYAENYTDINTIGMFSAMDKVATNTQVDINLFDPHGRLIRSTKPEVFDQYIVSARINPEAFHEINYLKKRLFINEETIDDISFHSLYAPIFNRNGILVAIANIPYFHNNSEFGDDASAIIATIINLYLLLLIASILGGSIISNSITRPLSIISNKLNQLSISEKSEHINYVGKDELGILVKSYNKMVDDLEESSKQLAQTEREHAWREMARQIAHEIKNPLTPMRLSIQHLIRLRSQNIPNWQERFDAVAISLLEQIDILSETASEFSSFAKFFNEDDSEIDLVELINDQFTLFDNRENITFIFEKSLESAFVYAKKSQITRACVNLISNSIQAIEQRAGGKIRITLRVENMSYRLDIEDNGPGVSEENQAKLFIPNFTTKSSGTGLGLAICKNIINQSHGSIVYEKSELGGANFIIRLPIHKK